MSKLGQKYKPRRIKHPKKKGNKFEIFVYKDLRPWIPDIQRTLGSGSSERNADLETSEYVIECKWWKVLTPTDLWKFWKKVEKQALARNKIPLLIFKQDYKGITVRYGIFRDGDRNIIQDYKDINYTLWKKNIIDKRLKELGGENENI
jgi:hypothetical protein